jgi:hypothetical protein
MEARVRQLAADLAAAIRDARKAGYSIEWPSGPEGLSSIAISETGRVVIASGAPEPDVAVEAAGLSGEVFSDPLELVADAREGVAVAPLILPDQKFKKRAIKSSSNQ